MLFSFPQVLCYSPPFKPVKIVFNFYLLFFINCYSLICDDVLRHMNDLHVLGQLFVDIARGYGGDHSWVKLTVVLTHRGMHFNNAGKT